MSIVSDYKAIRARLDELSGRWLPAAEQVEVVPVTEVDGAGIVGVAQGVWAKWQAWLNGLPKGYREFSNSNTWKTFSKEVDCQAHSWGNICGRSQSFSCIHNGRCERAKP